MKKLVILFGILFFSNFALADELTKEMRAEISMVNLAGNVVGLAPVRLTVTYPSRATLFNAGDCAFQVGKDDFWAFGVPSQTYPCIFLNGNAFVATDAIDYIIKRSGGFSILIGPDKRDYEVLTSSEVVLTEEKFFGDPAILAAAKIALGILHLANVSVVSLNEDAMFTEHRSGDPRSLTVYVRPKEVR